MAKISARGDQEVVRIVVHHWNDILEKPDRTVFVTTKQGRVLLRRPGGGYKLVLRRKRNADLSPGQLAFVALTRARWIPWSREDTRLVVNGEEVAVENAKQYLGAL